MLLCKKTRNGPGHWVFECFDSINNLCSNFSFIITTCCQYLQQKKRTRWTACDLPRSECQNSTPKHSSYQLLTAFASCWQLLPAVDNFDRCWQLLTSSELLWWMKTLREGKKKRKHGSKKKLKNDWYKKMKVTIDV